MFLYKQSHQNIKLQILFRIILPPPHQLTQRQTRRRIALPAGIPRHDQLSFRARDAHVQQAQAFLDVIQPRAHRGCAFFVPVIFTRRLERGQLRE